MAIAKVVSLYEGSSDGNGFTTSAINTSGATCIIASICDYTGNAASTLSDSKSNSYGAALVTQTSDISRLQLWVFASPVVGSGHTFTIAGGSFAPSLGVLAISGSALSSAADQTNSGASLAATTVQPGSITPSQANEIVVTTYGSTNTFDSIDAPFTPADGFVTVSGNHFSIGLAFNIQTSIAAANPTWTWLAAANAAAIIVSVKAAPSGGGPLIAGGELTKGSLIRGGRLTA